MRRTGRALVILTVAVWIAALTPARADTGPLRAPVPEPNPTADDPVRVGIGIGGEIIDVLSHDDDGDEDNGDDDNGDDNGDDDGTGLLDAVVALLVGEGDEDDDDDDDSGGLVRVLDRVVDVLVGEEDDAAAGPPFRPSDDNDGLVWELLGLGEDGDDDGLLDDLVELDDIDIDIDIEPVEDVIDILDDTAETVTDAVDAVVCVLVRSFDPTPTPPPPAPPQQPCA